MKNKLAIILSLVAFSLIVLYFVLGSKPEEGDAFNFAERKGQWLVQGDYVIIPNYIVDGEERDVCIIELESSNAYDPGQLFFISQYNPKFDQRFSYNFDTGRAGRTNKIYIDLKSHPAWKSYISAFLIVPGSKTRLISISFVKSNPITKLSAIWSDFTIHRDPLLGTCFAMASPLFFGKPFSFVVVPILWCLFVPFILILFIKIDDKIRKRIIFAFLAVVLIFWGILDLGNNVRYFKAILRDANLYWGKALVDKKGIVVGDPEYIKFMRFCDEVIPKDGWIYNFVPWELPGTASRYLSTTQFYFNLRPDLKRLFRELGMEPKPFYVYYKPEKNRVDAISQEQAVRSAYFYLKPGESISQKIKLWRDLRNLEELSFITDLKDVAPRRFSVMLLADDQKIFLGSGSFLRQEGDRVVFKANLLKDIKRNGNIYLEITNKGNETAGVYITYSQEYEDGYLIINGKKDNRDLTFRLDYNTEGVKTFRKFNDHAFILTE